MDGLSANNSNAGVPTTRDECREDVQRASRRLRTATIRAGCIGAALKGGLNLFGLLARAGARRPRRKGTLLVASFDAAKDTAAFASFLGTFAGVYVLVDEGLAVVCGNTRSKTWRAAVAGAIAAPALLLADARPKNGGSTNGASFGASGTTQKMTKNTTNGHHGLATYLALRASVLLTRSMLKRREHGTLSPTAHLVLTPFASKHADVHLMSAAAAVILSCFVMKPAALVRAYAKFLDRHGGKSVAHYRALGDLVLTRNAPDMRAVLEQAAVALKNPRLLLTVGEMDDRALMASRPYFWRAIIHPGQSSLNHFISFLLNAMPRSLAIYAPLYLVTTGLVHRTKLLDPKFGAKILTKAAVGTARSAAFLSAYCALAWAGPDFVQSCVGTANRWTVLLGVPLAGAATLIEKPSRRQELSVYCASRAVESMGVCLVSWGAVPSVVQNKVRVDVLTFAVASAAIMRCYANERDVFKSKYLNVLDYVFGNKGHGRRRVTHVGSAYQIATAPAGMTSPPTSPARKEK